MTAHIVGIDLGTTFSSLVRLDEMGRPEVLKNAEGSELTPSAVYLGHDATLAGQPALERGRDDPDRLVENAKRYIGTRSKGWTIAGRVYSPVAVSTILLRKLKADAEQQIGPISRAVLTVPAHFNTLQRQLTVQAGQDAGLDVIGLVNEPVAAALCYILGDQGLAYTSLAEDQKILVFDLGGGTFDLSLVHYNPEKIIVLAASGDLALGGIDWNQRLIDSLIERFRASHGFDLRQSKKFMRRLMEQVERAKRDLSDPGEFGTTIAIRFQKMGETFRLLRSEFEEMTKDLVERTGRLTEGLLRTAGFHWHQLNQVLPVGGSTRMPMIRNMIRAMCQRFMPAGFEPSYKLSPDLAVAQGAALFAGLLTAKEHGYTTSADQLQTFNPRSLGLVVRDEADQRINHILIPAHTPLPASAAVTVGTIKENQQKVTRRIVEGEDVHFKGDEIILQCVLDQLPEGLPKESAFDVDLTYEANGLLQVIGKHRASGRLVATTLERAEGPPS